MSEVEIPAPPGTKILLIAFSDDTTMRSMKDQAMHIRTLIKDAARRDDWPVVLFMAPGCTARWLETEKAP